MKQINILSRIFYFLIFVAAVVIGARTEAQSCPACQMDTKSAKGSADKCGFAELCNTSTPPKKYLEEKVYYIGYYNDYSQYINPLDGDPEDEIYQFSTCTDTKFDYLTCDETTNYSGTASTFVSYDSDDDLSATMNTDGSWSDDGEAYDTAEGIVVNAFGSGPGTETCSSTAKSDKQFMSSSVAFDLFYNVISGSLISSTVLSHPFTDVALREKLVSQMPNYPSEWACNQTAGSDWAYIQNGPNNPNVILHQRTGAMMPHYPVSWAANQNSSAYYHLSSDDSTAFGGKMQYRFHIVNCVSDPNASYLVKWNEVTTPDDTNSPVKVAHLQETIPNTGDPVNGAYGAVHEANVSFTPGTTNTVAGAADPEIPMNPSTVTETSYTVTVVPSSTGTGGGGGSGPGGGGPTGPAGPLTN